MILTGDHAPDDLSSKLDSAVFPGTQGGPLMHIIAAKAVGFKEALEDEFVEYSEQIVKNSKALANRIKYHGYKLVTQGTSNHCALLDFRGMDLTGKMAEEKLESEGITANKNLVPYDMESPFVTSGLRVGTPAMTTRGFKEAEFETVADMIANVLMGGTIDVEPLCKKYPLI
jgi:glycine hydroxymethyltransferase